MMVEGDGEIRLVLNRAAAAARRTGSTEIQPGHLLLGIVELPGSRGAVLLEELGLDIDQVRRALGLSMDVEMLGMRPPSLSAASIEALQLADTEATRAGMADTGSDDLVLALVQSRGSLVAGILESLGASEEAVRLAIARMRGGGPEAERLAEGQLGGPAQLDDEHSGETSGPAFMSPEWVDDLRERSENMDQFPEAPGDLIRVVAIGKVVDAAGWKVQLTALEVRSNIMFLHWRASSGLPHLLGEADVAVSDPLGTRYGVIHVSGGGSDTERSGELWIFPAVPENVGELAIEIRRFREPTMLFGLGDEIPQGPLVGPWRFAVAL